MRNSYIYIIALKRDAYTGKSRVYVFVCVRVKEIKKNPEPKLDRCVWRKIYIYIYPFTQMEIQRENIYLIVIFFSMKNIHMLINFRLLTNIDSILETHTLRNSTALQQTENCGSHRLPTQGCQI